MNIFFKYSIVDIVLNVTFSFDVLNRLPPPEYYCIALVHETNIMSDIRLDPVCLT